MTFTCCRWCLCIAGCLSAALLKGASLLVEDVVKLVDQVAYRSLVKCNAFPSRCRSFGKFGSRHIISHRVPAERHGCLLLAQDLTLYARDSTARLGHVKRTRQHTNHCKLSTMTEVLFD